MISVLSNFFGNALLLEDLCRGNNFLALHVADPTAAGLASTQLAGSSRQPIGFSLPAGRSTVSTNAQRFPGLPAAQVSHFGVWDDVVAGHLLVIVALNPQLLVGGDLVWPAGEVAISL